jgi:hypothetical protein
MVMPVIIEWTYADGTKEGRETSGECLDEK